VPQTVTEFCAGVSRLSDAALAGLAGCRDPELALAGEPGRLDPAEAPSPAPSLPERSWLSRLWHGAGA
jgi:hypothetical protein